MSPLGDGGVEQLRRALDAPDLESERYAITERLGEGGMGAVYLAEDRLLGRPVAIKVLHLEDLSEEGVERMRREAHTLARLEHPGIVPIHDLGVLSDGRAWYAMKRVRGEQLDRHVTAATPVAERLRLWLKICETVSFAHAAGVLHRDLKPGNVMVGEFGEVLVLDWGVAKWTSRGGDRSEHLGEVADSGSARTRGVDEAADPGSARAREAGAPIRSTLAARILRFALSMKNRPSSLTQPPIFHTPPDGTPASRARSESLAPLRRDAEADRDPLPSAGVTGRDTAPGTILGTPAFMAPEQSAGDSARIDERTDVYGLGSTLFFVLTGRVPGVPGAPPEPRALAAICARAMAPDPAERYRSAAELAADVQRYLEGSRVLAHAEGPWERIGRLLRKYQVPIGLVLAYLLVRVALWAVNRR